MAEIRYWKDADVLDIVVKKGRYKFSESVAEGVILDISQSGEILGIEIHQAMEKLAPALARRLAHRYAVATR